MRPKARGKGLVVRDLRDEVMIFDTERNQAHCLNRTAASVWRQCDGKRSIVQIEAAASRELGSPLGHEAVLSIFAELDRARLFEGRLIDGRASRRAALGVTAAITATTVISVLVPNAQAASSCTGANGPCTSSTQCCNGLTCQPVGPHGMKVCRA
jgi:hypothetical protein